MISLVGWIPAVSDQLTATPAAANSRPPLPVPSDNIAQKLQEQALPELIHSITETKPVRRLRVIHIAGDIHDHRASPFLVRAYEESTDEGIRCKLLESLGKLHDPALFGWYVQRLEDPSIGIQCFTIWALGELKIPQSVAPLLKKLWNPNRYVQMTVIDALGKTGRDLDVASQLGVFLHDDDVQVRYLAAKALAGVAGPDAVPELLERLMQEHSVDVQEALAKTLGRVGGSVAAWHFIELLKNPESQDKEHWAEVGLQAGEPAVVIPEIAPLVEGSDFRLKVAAARILSDLEIPAPMEPSSIWRDRVARWSQSSSPVVRDAAIQLMERIESVERQSGDTPLR